MIESNRDALWSFAAIALATTVACSSSPAPADPQPITDPPAETPIADPRADPPVIDTSVISAEFPYDKKYVEINGSRMAYVDVGSGPVVLFMHGNPTSSYLWRNVIPHVSHDHRAIAIDLMGMGDSDKPDIEYSFAQHAEYVDGFIAALDLKDITLVVHDWGSGLGMRYARLNEGNVRALAFMEALVPPGMPVPSYEAMGPFGDVFLKMRTEGVGEAMILENNMFIEVLLPQLIMRKLTDAEMAEYRRPYPTPESRRPTLKWPREVPIGGVPEHTTNEVTLNGQWLLKTDMPKLFVHATPGAINTPEVVEYIKANAKNLTTADVGQGTHFIQEDRPHEIGKALSDWLAGQ
jgi:haloalkane dehalogenase